MTYKGTDGREITTVHEIPALEDPKEVDKLLALFDDMREHPEDYEDEGKGI